MSRVLVVPAAGRGSRLGWDGPKVLCPVAGRPMLDHLLDRYRPYADRIVLVLAPGARAAVDAHLHRMPIEVECVEQEQPTGMLPAILSAHASIARLQPTEIWITWCDQIGISANTLDRLADEMSRHPDAALTFPTVRQKPPYIHFPRDDSGRITGVLQRREGDQMPPVGESDAGLFGLTGPGFLEELATYARQPASPGRSGERNFLPFIPWLAGRAPVHTFALADDREALGVNTPEDLRSVEAYLRGRP